MKTSTLLHRVKKGGLVLATLGLAAAGFAAMAWMGSYAVVPVTAAARFILRIGAADDDVYAARKASWRWWATAVLSTAVVTYATVGLILTRCCRQTASWRSAPPPFPYYPRHGIDNGRRSKPVRRLEFESFVLAGDGLESRSDASLPLSKARPSGVRAMALEGRQGGSYSRQVEGTLFLLDKFNRMRLVWNNSWHTLKQWPSGDGPQVSDESKLDAVDTTSSDAPVPVECLADSFAAWDGRGDGFASFYSHEPSGEIVRNKYQRHPASIDGKRTQPLLLQRDVTVGGADAAVVSSTFSLLPPAYTQVSVYFTRAGSGDVFAVLPPSKKASVRVSEKRLRQCGGVSAHVASDTPILCRTGTGLAIVLIQAYGFVFHLDLTAHPSNELELLIGASPHTGAPFFAQPTAARYQIAAPYYAGIFVLDKEEGCVVQFTKDGRLVQAIQPDEPFARTEEQQQHGGAAFSCFCVSDDGRDIYLADAQGHRLLHWMPINSEQQFLYSIDTRTSLHRKLPRQLPAKQSNAWASKPHWT